VLEWLEGLPEGGGAGRCTGPKIHGNTILEVRVGAVKRVGDQSVLLES
jgi:hypothetical protein